MMGVCSYLPDLQYWVIFSLSLPIGEVAASKFQFFPLTAGVGGSHVFQLKKLPGDLIKKQSSTVVIENWLCLSSLILAVNPIKFS